MMEWEPFQVLTCVSSPLGPLLAEGVAYGNNLYTVVKRVLEDGSVWLSIKSNDNTARHDWRHLQKIKNELVGPEVEAVELYPAESRLVDTSNQYHLWCLPPGFRMPYGFNERLVSEVEIANTRQRPFESAVRPADLTPESVIRERLRLEARKG